MKTTIPYWIEQLVNFVKGDVKKAAQLMEVDASTIRKALAAGQTTERQEAKAIRALNAEEARREAEAQAASLPKQVLVSIPPAKLETFHKVAGAMGLEVMVL